MAEGVLEPKNAEIVDAQLGEFTLRTRRLEALPRKWRTIPTSKGHWTTRLVATTYELLKCLIGLLDVTGASCRDGSMW